MKKKMMLLCFLLLFTSGCATIQNTSYEDLISTSVSSNVHITNIARAGYKYYLPKGLRLLRQEGSNEILSDKKSIYYLYVDYISYFNKIKEEYVPKENVVYSQKIENGDLFGYLEIKNTSNDKYFIEIMYNYAKIEVIVEKEEAKKTVAYAMSILSSINYQDTVLTSLMGEDILKSNEVQHNIFETAQTESGYLEIVEEYGQYEEKEEIVDPDFIRR